MPLNRTYGAIGPCRLCGIHAMHTRDSGKMSRQYPQKLHAIPVGHQCCVTREI